MADLYLSLQSLLFRFPAEQAHALGLGGLRLGRRLGLLGLFHDPLPEDPRTVMGLRFPNPIGVAAGLDKDAEAVRALFALGFGAVEVGTVTPRPQPGNPRPRLYRLPARQALLNRMGFNNAGLDALRARLEHLRRDTLPGVLGVNIGRNKSTPNASALSDYRTCLEGVYPLADYVVINISSPNTPGLRELQQGDALRALLEPLLGDRENLAPRHGRRVPLVLKVAPDLQDAEIHSIAALVGELSLDGLICGNTTRSRTGIEDTALASQEGGLSGGPLKERADRVLELFHRHLPESVARIGVGGITTGEDAADKLRHGADLVQFYSGLIFRGPALVGECRQQCLDQPSRGTHESVD